MIKKNCGLWVYYELNFIQLKLCYIAEIYIMTFLLNRLKLLK